MAVDLTKTTREAWMSTVQRQVIDRIPLFAILNERRQVSWDGGTKYKTTVEKATSETLAQEYSANDPLNVATKSIWETVEFEMKYIQVPIEYTVEHRLQAREGDGVVIDHIGGLVRSGQNGVKLRIRTSLWETASNTSDTDVGFQGIPDALDSNDSQTYGTIARNTANTWWNGADDDNCDTTTEPTIENFREFQEKVLQDTEFDSPQDMMAFCSSATFRALQAAVEAHHGYPPPGVMAKFGFSSMMIDGIEIVVDPHLNKNSTDKKKFALLHLPDWYVKLSPERSFKLTDFRWQGEVANGYDKWLARALVAGNICCLKPNGSLYRAEMNVS
jgi:hypothetical protein